MKHRIIIEENQFGTNDTRSFHLTLQVSNMENVSYRKYPSFFNQAPFGQPLPVEMGAAPSPDQTSPEQLKEAAGEVGHKLAEQIMTLAGILAVTLHPFRIDVEKATCFEWDSLSPEIKKALLAAYKEKDIAEVGLEVRKPEDWDETPQGKATRAQIAIQERLVRMMEKELGDDDKGWRG